MIRAVDPLISLPATDPAIEPVATNGSAPPSRRDDVRRGLVPEDWAGDLAEGRFGE